MLARIKSLANLLAEEVNAEDYCMDTIAEYVDDLRTAVHTFFMEERAARRDEEDEMYERMAARARSNDFADTNGKDWT